METCHISHNRPNQINVTCINLMLNYKRVAISEVRVAWQGFYLRDSWVKWSGLGFEDAAPDHEMKHNLYTYLAYMYFTFCCLFLIPSTDTISSLIRISSHDGLPPCH